MVAEELKVVIRAEAQRAAREISEVTKQTNKAENSTRKLITTMAKSAAGFAAAAVSVRALIGAVKESVELAGIQEQAERGLEAALVGVGDASTESANMLKNYASELQGVTTFGDEATLSAAALFTQLTGMSAEMTRNALPAIQDFASAMGMDLNNAAQIVGKSIGSSTNALTRYGVEIDNSLTGSERLEAIVGELDTKFGGFSESVADTASGSLVQFQNAMGDLKEVGGAAVLDFIEPAVSGMKSFVENVTEAITESRNLRDVLNSDEQVDDIDRLNSAIDEQRQKLEDMVDISTNVSARSVEEAQLESLLKQREALRQRNETLEQYGSTSQEYQDFLESEAAAEARQAEMTSIAWQKRLEIAEEYTERIENAEANALERIELDRQRALDDAAESYVRTGEEIELINAFFDKKREQALQESIDRQIAIIREGLGDDLDGDRYGAMVSSLTDKWNANYEAMKQAADGTDEYAERVRKVQDAVSNVSTAFSAGMGAIDAWSHAFDSGLKSNIENLESLLSEMDERQERELAFAEAAGASEEELTELRQQQREEQKAAEEELEEKKRELARKEFQRQKAINIANATMNTAEAVTSALTAGPVAGPILAGIVGALGAAQIAGIAAQPAPAFEKGGSFVTDGPQMIQVGDGQSPRERVTVEPLSGPYSSGGSGGITINISGVIGDRERVAEWVNEGIRRGRQRGAIRG